MRLQELDCSAYRQAHGCVPGMSLYGRWTFELDTPAGKIAKTRTGLFADVLRWAARVAAEAQARTIILRSNP
jgi:hypothetical protein